MNTDKIKLAERLGAIQQEDKTYSTPPSYQKDINEAFTKFLDTPIPKEIELYEITGQQVVIRVFDFTPNSDTKRKILIDASGSTAEGTGYRSFPVAKVLAAGPDSSYTAGDIVKLRDFEVRTIPNPKYEAWSNNPYSKSNMQKVGSEPQAVINNMRVVFQQKMFSLRPLAEHVSEEDYVTFKVADANLECKIKNPHGLLID